MNNTKMTSIMMRGSLAHSASKEHMSASATMLPPIPSRNNIVQNDSSAEKLQIDRDYDASPVRLVRDKMQPNPVSKSLIPHSSKGASRKKAKGGMILTTSVN